MLQMPCAVIGTGSAKEGTFCLYLVENQDSAKLYALKSLIKETCLKLPTDKGPTKQEMTKLLNLAESESEKSRLKYAVVKSAGLSSNKAKTMYGFNNMNSRKQDLEKAMEEADAIRQAIENIAKIKEKSILHPLGVLESSESDLDETESETDPENIPESGTEVCLLQYNPLDGGENESEGSGQLLSTADSIKGGCMDSYGSSEGITSESESSDADIWAMGVGSALDERGKLLIKKRRAAMRRKTSRTIKKRLAEKRLSKRRRSKKVGKILSDFPSIGKDIEDFVKQSGAGADAWRRTGALTFDGNRKVKKKATFKRIKEHLEEKYGRKISYGTIVQLCVPRNKRRRSAARYRGIANVISKRARKGFNIRYNPDQHWSAAFYSGLEQLQYEDGNDIVNLGWDDQAGFRLDTMSTHKQHATLCIKGKQASTTRSDYVNKYPSVLQTTSYNFPSTGSTGEICAGVVKAQVLHSKNAAQHYADLQMLEMKEEVKLAFWNARTQKRKEVECARVDGSFDEGPSHGEVQYWWTVRHLNVGSRMTLVTSRNSGASYKNRVELQNGCFALGHANLFIPSTLNGSCLSSGGKVNYDLLRDNLNSAIEVYTSRVDKAPCAGTVINLYRGADSSSHQIENDRLKIFLKGKKEEKEKLKEDHPEEFARFEAIWNLRERHMRKDVPLKYIFCLHCCYKEECEHPLCREGEPREEPTWYAGGPPLSFLPVPCPDPKRCYGREGCKECDGVCCGHYRKCEDLWEHVSKHASRGRYVHEDPPSEVILEEYNKHRKIPDKSWGWTRSAPVFLRTLLMLLLKV